MNIQEPGYINRNFEHDFPNTNASDDLKKQITRVSLAVLPFFTLYKPFGYAISLSMGSLRLYSSSKSLWENTDHLTLKFLNATASAAGVAGTYFRHPLGLLIATLHDLLFDLQNLRKDFSHRDNCNTIVHLLKILNNILYAGLFLGGGAQTIAISLTLKSFVCFIRSYSHSQKKGEKLEAVSILLMGLIRGHQAIRGFQGISIRNEMQKAKDKGKPYLPLANRMQKLFVKLGYKINWTARWSARQIGHLLASPMPKENYVSELSQRIQTSVKLAFSIPIALVSFAFSTPCYLLASYVGTGRFEKIKSTTESSVSSKDKANVVFQNICGQDPWSIFSGGVAPPLEKGENENSRLNKIIDEILKENPDVYCGQEYDDLATSEKAGRLLSEAGYNCIRDLGCNDPLLNHSGLFIAVRGSLESAEFIPFNPEDTSGIGSWCNRGILSTVLSFPNGKKLTIVNLHLNPGGESDQESRIIQLQKYISPILQKGPFLAVGDSNLDTSLLSAQDKARAGLKIGMVNELEGRVTCTDEGKHIINGIPREGCSDCEERIDVAIYDPENVEISNLSIQPGNSDHHLISLVAKPI